MVDADLYGELKNLCRRSLPERLDQSVSQIRSVAEGRHPVVSMSLAWREGRQPRVEKLLVRRYADPWTWWATDGADKAQTEWTVMRWLYGLGYPIPPLYASGASGKEPYLLKGSVSGRQVSLEDGVEAENYARWLAVELSRLHRLTPPASVRDALQEISLKHELARLADLAAQCANEDLEKAVTSLYRDDMEGLPLCVLHGDPRSENVLCDAQGITALVGWEDAVWGDPRWDIARAMNELYAGESRAPAASFRQVYEDRTGWRLEDLTYWMALTATQRWVLVEWADTEERAEQAAGLLAEREPIRERAWRALTRLRHGDGQ